MLIRADVLAAIRAGEVDLAFRRWPRPRVRVGTRLRTAVGLVEVVSLGEVDVGTLTTHDARRAGADSVEVLRAALDGQHRDPEPEQPLWRIGVTYAGTDPRELLREEVPDAAGLERLRHRLARLDRAATSSGADPWTATTLELVDAHPGRRAPELAAEVGRETAPFKRDVRKLKELGLTESLDIGYRLSPRGEAVLDHVRRAAGRRVPVRPPRASGTSLSRGIGAPATRALRAEGLTTLEQVAGRRRDDLAALHGVGPVALARLDDLLAAAGLDWAD